ncbi:MAG: tRNA1(Val) (adenine(37)-N6)-methyltransferase [Bacteroidales bacterium]
MANNWFKCKQFEIRQELCGHKVGTDSFLLGAWANVSKASKILDIGTGTGILSLMAAQRSEANITAIEIDKDAAEQAMQNFRNSPWFSRLKLYHISLEKFDASKEKYDVIICNPPYFLNSKNSPNPKRTLARHAHSLTLLDILNFANKHLKANGHVSIIMPIEHFQYFLDLIKTHKWYIHRLTKVFPKPSKDAHRLLVEFGKKAKGFEYDELIIETEQRHIYTKKYYELTKDFYLNAVCEEV